ncbi:MAG: hypothetical protein LBB17_02495 [Puniceicoccales bacterium]|nr:hypothetical protein [Puniceicoccales bacterium]
MKNGNSIPRGLLVGLIIWLFPMAVGCTQTGGTLGDTPTGTGTSVRVGCAIEGKGEAALGDTIGGLGSEAAARKEQTLSAKTSHKETAAHTHEHRLELEKQKLEVECQRTESEKETPELEKAK